MQGHDRNYVCHKDIYWKENLYPSLIVQRQMSKYAVGCQHLHESDLYHQHSSYQFLRYNEEKQQLLQTGIPLSSHTHGCMVNLQH